MGSFLLEAINDRYPKKLVQRPGVEKTQGLSTDCRGLGFRVQGFAAASVAPRPRGVVGGAPRES